jgi:uncharacterized OB-fold protein
VWWWCTDECGLDDVARKDRVVSVELFAAGEPGTRTALLASSCGQCGRAEFPRRASCPACGAATEKIELAGPATLRVSTAVLAQAPGSQVQAPYNVGVAEFRQGLCVLGLLVDEPEIGATVDVVVHEPYDGGRIFAFAESAR